MFGNRDDLLEHAGDKGEMVVVVVSSGMQTAVVEMEAQVLLHFNSILRNVSGEVFPDTPLQNLTIRLYRQVVDEFGTVLPERRVLTPTSSSGNRINVSTDDEYFISIGNATLEDRGVYIIEICQEGVPPMEVCVNASATLFVLDGESFSFGHSDEN